MKGRAKTLAAEIARRRFLSETRRGPLNPVWKGDAAKPKSGRSRARSLYREIPPCRKCGNVKSERHHRDGNTLNNSPENIDFLCRRCHMQEDGRLAAFSLIGSEARKRGIERSIQARKSKTHCKRNHPLSGKNLRIYRGLRVCITCERTRPQRRVQK